MHEIQSHKRVNDILLGPLERPALQWLAAHMPAWVNPDILTIIGVVGTLVTFSGYWLTHIHPAFLWVASLGFLINWFGDSLDGTLARYRKIERPRYGFYVDHLVDAVNEVMIFLGIGLSPYLRFDIACLALVGYLLLSILVFVRMCVFGVFQISFGRLGPTEIRVIAILANTWVFFFGNPRIQFRFGSFTVYDLIGIVVTLILFSIFIVTMTTQALQLSKMDALARKIPPSSDSPVQSTIKEEKITHKRRRHSTREHRTQSWKHRSTGEQSHLKI